MMKFLFLLFVPCWLWAQSGSEQGLKGYVQIRTARQLWVDWSYAKPGKPTVVLLNGVTYSTWQWDAFAQQLIEQGIGVVRFEPRGMGMTLRLHAPVLSNIEIQEQAKDLHDLVQTLKLQTPLNLVGLSYGGGLAFYYASMYPQDVGRLIAMAPYTEPIKAQDEWIKSQIWLTRQTQPWNLSSDDALYEFFFRQIVYWTYPYAEPVTLANPFKLEGIVRLGLGIRKFRASDVASSFPAHSIHLVIAGKDQYIPRSILEDFWSHVPESARASKMVIGSSGHKVPEEAPKFSAAWVMEILKDSKVLQSNVEFDGDPATGLVKYEGGQLQLKAE